MASNSSKKKLSGANSKKLIPALRALNKLTAAMVKLLTEQVVQKEQKMNTLSVMVSNMTVPQKRHTIAIHTVDINNTQIVRKGMGSYSQKMDWEDMFKAKKKGRVI